MIVLSLTLLIIFEGTKFVSADRHEIGPSRGDYQSHHTPWSSGGSSSSYGWGMSNSASGYQSFFDMALTGLAFMSFGIFLLNLLLNSLFGGGLVTATFVPTGTGTIGTGIITNTATGTGITIPGIDPDPDPVDPTDPEAVLLGRGKRETFKEFDISLDPVSSADNIAKLVLKSMDSMLIQHECVQKMICDGNKEAKAIGRGFQYFMPAYSLGASYVARKVGLHRNMTKHVSAILHGIQESNCQFHFPQC